jgi:hypothetical protein
MNQGSDAQVLLQAQPEHGDRPAQFFQIGSDGGEERYYLDLSQTSSPIYSCDLETWTLTQRAEDIQAWIAECQAREEEIQQDELALRRKHWWQFWR